MGIDCLNECPECNRHVRCGERACPFCGAKVDSFMRVLEYRIINRLDRSRVFSLGAALTAAGFLTNCVRSEAIYGAPCNPPACGPNAGSGGQAGEPGVGGGDTSGGGVPATAGAPPSSEGGEPGEGGSSGGGAPTAGGAGGEDALGGASGAPGGAGGEGGAN